MTAAAGPSLVSVVVASYNHAEFLQQRMQSLIDQTYEKLEIIVIDDASPDNSVEILRKYESDPRVKLIVRERNGGWVTVSNQGGGLASGEFVLFANCDDACDPRMVERLVHAMDVHPTAGIAFCRSLLVDEQDRILGDDFSIRESSFRAMCSGDILIRRHEMSRFLLHSCVIPNLSAALIRKDCFVSAGQLSSSYRVCCDWDLFFRIVERHDVAYVAAPLNRFRQHKTTIRSVTKARVVYEEFFRLLLSQIKVLNLGFLDRCRFRTRVMSMWAGHILTSPWSAMRNFPYHFGRVARVDAAALPFFAPGLMIGVARGVAKLLQRRVKAQA